MPGFADVYDRKPFHPYFIKSLLRFSTIRFMDVMSTNSANDQVTWSKRARRGANNADVADFRMPIEDMVLLSNTVGANPWFCIPYSAVRCDAMRYCTKAANHDVVRDAG